ncbi:hypothetical protein BH23BAC1_BH23BAC1_21110 [soil metagenome]
MNQDYTIDRKFRLARIWSNQELKKIAHLFSGSVVNVSAGENIDKEGKSYDEYFTKCSSFSLTNFFPGAFRGFEGRENEYLLDLTGEVPRDLIKRFDVVFNHTTLEHIFDVFTAFRNLCNLSKDILIIVIPFAQVQHETDVFKDYWRISPSCLRKLYEENGFQVIYESCNNDVNAAVYLFFVGSRNPEKWKEITSRYKPITEAGSWIGTNDHKPKKKLQFLKKILQEFNFF